MLFSRFLSYSVSAFVGTAVTCSEIGSVGMLLLPALLLFFCASCCCPCLACLASALCCLADAAEAGLYCIRRTSSDPPPIGAGLLTLPASSQQTVKCQCYSLKQRTIMWGSTHLRDADLPWDLQSQSLMPAASRIVSLTQRWFTGS